MMGLEGHGEEIIDVRRLRAFGNLYARETGKMYQSIWHMSSGKSGDQFGSSRATATQANGRHERCACRKRAVIGRHTECRTWDLLLTFSHCIGIAA
jgi:hypothetical protein